MRQWQDADGTHIDVRGLSPPQPLVEILRLVQSAGEGEAVIAHLDRDPQMLYPELGADRLAGRSRRGRSGRARRNETAADAHPGMTPPPGAFLGGAKGRLLPASIPLRFFGAATAFHLLAWVALGAGALQGVGFGGGLGWPLAALHLVTLGVLAMTALGAGAQLLPVATRRPAPGHRLLAAIWWLYTPGVAVLALGMGLARVPWLAAGAAMVALALAAWCVLMLGNLLGARGMPGVVAHGWGAMVVARDRARDGARAGRCLAGLAGAVARHAAGAAPPVRALRLHGAAGARPVLHPGADVRARGRARRARASSRPSDSPSAALVLAALAAPACAGRRRACALARPSRCASQRCSAAAAAIALHLRMMRAALRGGMRRELGRSFTLVRIAWGGLLASLLLALALVLDAPVPRLGALFGLCLIGVWLLSFVLGILQRILPFLAAMHGGSGRRARTPSALTHDGALRVHFVCHLVALGLLALAIGADLAWLALAAAAVGGLGAIAFGVFYVVLLRRMRSPAR